MSQTDFQNADAVPAAAVDIGYRLASLSIAGCAPFPALVIGDKALAIGALVELARTLSTPLSGTAKMHHFLEDWTRNNNALIAITDHIRTTQEGQRWWQDVAVESSKLRFHAPIDQPRQIFCAGANYRQHVVDLLVDQPSPAMEGLDVDARRAAGVRIMEERATKGNPYFFSKVQSAVSGPFDPIVVPCGATEPDWELELAVVIGCYARYVSVADALDYVAGYTIVNDITNRDLVYRRDMKAIGTDWLRGKSSPGYMPMGPYLVPASQVGDPQKLHVTLKLNGDVMQSEGTDDMIFGVARLISELSASVELWPGDIVATGSPSGNGTHYKRFLREGDVLEGTITGLGEQRNVCIHSEGSR